MANPQTAPKGSNNGAKAKTQGKIFISYRWADSAASAGRIHDWLVQRLPVEKVFFDVETIEYGVDFERRIAQSLPQCRAVLAIIGPHWLEGKTGPSRYVRFELELALRAGIPILPVLVDGASMPAQGQLPDSLQELPRLNAAQVRSGRDFSHDMDDLAAALHISVKPRAQIILSSPRFWLLVASLVVLAAFAAIALLTSRQGPITAAAPDPRAGATLTAAVHDAATMATRIQTASSAATATASASAAATATAAAPYTFFAAAPGPNCNNSGKWSVSSSGGSAGVACQSSSAHLTEYLPNTLSLYYKGADGFAFSPQFTVSVDVSNMQAASAGLGFDMLGRFAFGQTYTLQVYPAGQWTVVRSQGQGGLQPPVNTTIGQGSVPAATTYQLAITSDGSTYSFAINSQTVATQQLNLQAPSDFFISDTPSGQPHPNGPINPIGTFDVANFSVLPRM